MAKIIVLISVLLLISACQPSSSPQTLSDDNGKVSESPSTQASGANTINKSGSVAEQDLEVAKGSNVTNETSASMTKRENGTASQEMIKAKGPIVGVKLANIPSNWEDRGARAGAYCSQDYQDFDGIWDDLSPAQQKYTLKCLEVNCLPLCRGQLVNKCEMQCQYSGKAYIKQFLKR